MSNDYDHYEDDFDGSTSMSQVVATHDMSVSSAAAPTSPAYIASDYENNNEQATSALSVNQPSSTTSSSFISSTLTNTSSTVPTLSNAPASEATASITANATPSAPTSTRSKTSSASSNRFAYPSSSRSAAAAPTAPAASNAAGATSHRSTTSSNHPSALSTSRSTAAPSPSSHVTAASSSSSSSTPSLLSDPRATAEYQVAWELEQWRRSTQKQLLSQWQKEEARRMKELEEEFKRHELVRETQAQHKQAKLEALEKKFSQALFDVQQQERTLKLKETEVAIRVSGLDREIANIKSESEVKVARIRDQAKYESNKWKTLYEESQTALATAKQKIAAWEAKYNGLEEEYSRYKGRVQKTTVGELRLALTQRELEIQHLKEDVTRREEERDALLAKLDVALNTISLLKAEEERREKERLLLEHRDVERLRLAYINRQKNQGLRRDQEELQSIQKEIRLLLQTNNDNNEQQQQQQQLTQQQIQQQQQEIFSLLQNSNPDRAFPPTQIPQASAAPITLTQSIRSQQQQQQQQQQPQSRTAATITTTSSYESSGGSSQSHPLQADRSIGLSQARSVAFDDYRQSDFVHHRSRQEEEKQSTSDHDDKFDHGPTQSYSTTRTTHPVHSSPMQQVDEDYDESPIYQPPPVPTMTTHVSGIPIIDRTHRVEGMSVSTPVPRTVVLSPHASSHVVPSVSFADGSREPSELDYPYEHPSEATTTTVSTHTGQRARGASGTQTRNSRTITQTNNTTHSTHRPTSAHNTQTRPFTSSSLNRQGNQTSGSSRTRAASATRSTTTRR